MLVMLLALIAALFTLNMLVGMLARVVGGVYPAEKVVKMLVQIGVHLVGLIDYADLASHDPKELTYSRFMEMSPQLRGSSQASAKDIVDSRSSLCNS